MQSFKSRVNLFLIGTLFSSCVYLFYQNHKLSNKKPIIIAVERGVTRVVSQDDNSVREQELINFMKDFVENYFNFDNQSYKKRITSYSKYFSKDLWRTKEEREYQKLTSFIERTNYSEKAKIRKIEFNDESETWVLHLKTKRVVNSKETTKEGVVYLKIKSIPRTIDNPWGVEINDITRKI